MQCGGGAETLLLKPEASSSRLSQCPGFQSRSHTGTDSNRLPRLLAFPLGVAVLEEGVDALVLVLGGEQVGEQFGLVLDALL